MAAIKIVRRSNKERKNGTAPLALRISKDYKTNYTFLGQYVLEKDWDEEKGQVKRSYPNSQKLNNYLLKKLTQANDVLFLEDKVSSKEIKRKVKGSSSSYYFFPAASDRVKSKYDRGVFSVANSELSMLYNLEEFLNHSPVQNKSEANAQIKDRRKKRISEGRKVGNYFTTSLSYFKKHKELRFEDINEAFIEKYKTFCKAYLEQKTRTITNQLIFIRTLFNIAIKEGVVDARHYPFGGDNVKIRIGTGNKIGLTSDEVKKIENLNFEIYSSLWHTKNVWLISFYFAGMRISDIVKLSWTDIKNDRLYYIMNKNEKPLSFKIPEKAKSVLDHYERDRRGNNGYIFPFLKDVPPNDLKLVFTKTRNATKVLNTFLKRIAEESGIDKNLSNHIARHTFGNIAGDKIHPLMLQKLYRHSDLKTTLNYQANFIHKEADDALDSVINF